MKPWRTWLACLGVLGALMIIAGCGSGDIPDPGSDSQAAAPPTDGAPPQQPVAPAPAPPQKVAAAEGKAEDAKGEETTAQAEALAPAEKPAGAGAGAGGGNAPPADRSATAEMLALATKEQPAPPAAGDAAPGGAPAQGGASGAGGGPGMAPRPPGGGGPGGMGPGGQMGGMAAGMQGQMQQQQQMQAQMAARMQGQMRGQMAGQMAGQMQPGAGMPGGGPGGNADKPADFRTPEGAVDAFLNALKARDLNRLTEATALRAGTQNETVKHNQEMFRRIFDGTLSESELNSLAALLEGYQISGANQQKSTARLGVILSKSGDTNSMKSIVVYVRKEKKGWGVCDISRPAEIKNPTYGPMRSRPKRS